MTTPTERRIEAALTGTVDVSDEETAARIAGELYDFGQRAWALRARIVDLRDIDVTFTVSVAMLDLLRKYGLDLGAGPGGMFERAANPGGTDRLFGIDVLSDDPRSASEERHRDVTLSLLDEGPRF